MCTLRIGTGVTSNFFDKSLLPGQGDILDSYTPFPHVRQVYCQLTVFTTVLGTERGVNKYM